MDPHFQLPKAYSELRKMLMLLQIKVFPMMINLRVTSNWISFGGLTKDNTFQHCKSEQDFISSNTEDGGTEPG